MRYVALQGMATLCAALITGAVAGVAAGVSTALGGAAVTVPNAVFALRLRSSQRQRGGPSVTTFLAGEFVKLGLTVSALAVVVAQYGGLVWPALLVGIIVALKSYLLILVMGRD